MWGRLKSLERRLRKLRPERSFVLLITQYGREIPDECQEALIRKEARPGLNVILFPEGDCPVCGRQH